MFPFFDRRVCWPTKSTVRRALRGPIIPLVLMEEVGFVILQKITHPNHLNHPKHKQQLYNKQLYSHSNINCTHAI